MIQHRGLRHLALNVSDVARAQEFYQRVFGMRVAWQPDPDNAYLSSGCDSLALHRRQGDSSGSQALEHLGFIVPSMADLDMAYQWAVQNHLELEGPLHRHRDGSVSFYLRDPDHNLVQVLYEPSISPLVIERSGG